MYRYDRTKVGRHLVAPAALLAAALPFPAGGSERGPSLHFFEGRTEMTSVVKVVMKKPYRSRTMGSGQILPDGSLALIQLVQDAGKPPHQRHWKIRRVGVDRFAGTMSEASGPVTVREIKGRYRLNFKMKGGLAVEQWVTPLPGGQAAQSTITVRKMGIRVARSDGMIRKL